MRETLLTLHFIGLAMALGVGFSNLVLGSVASKLEPAERGSFMAKIAKLAPVGQIGLGLLILSGLGLMTPYWKSLGDMPTLIVKLTCVGILLISVITILSLVAKMKREKNPALMGKIKAIGMLNFVLGITIVILAVLTFR
jgi:uncharacterized membrane protein